MSKEEDVLDLTFQICKKCGLVIKHDTCACTRNKGEINESVD